MNEEKLYARTQAVSKRAGSICHSRGVVVCHQLHSTDEASGDPFYLCLADVLTQSRSFTQICWTCSRVCSNDPELSIT